MPAEIDISNADRVRDALVAALAPGLRVLIADLDGTSFCDASGARAFVRARQRAVENGTGLRLVVPHSGVRRVLQAIDLDHLVPIYDCLSAAIAPDYEASGQQQRGLAGDVRRARLGPIGVTRGRVAPALSV
jgi:anti-anti-sigma factor